MRALPHVRCRPRYAVPALSGLVALLAPMTRSDAQTERRTLVGDRVAVYNLVGRVQVEGGSGSDVSVEVERGGRNGGALRIATGEIGGRETLRVIYDEDRIVYSEMGRRGRTQLSVNADGTFGDSNDHGDDRDHNKVEITSSGSGAEEYADLRVTVPRGRSLELHLAVGEVRVANVEGDLRIDVAAATITTKHTRGTLSLDTGAGQVDVQDVDGDVDLDTGSGGVNVSGVRGNTLKMDTGSGSLTAS